MTTLTMPARFRGAGPERLATAILFLMPALALTTSFGIGLAQLLILFVFAWQANRGVCAIYAGHGRALAPILAGFGGYFLVSLLRLVYFKQGLHTLDGPFHLLLGLSGIGVIAHARPRIRAFWFGLCVGAIGAGALALAQRLLYGSDRVQGFTHHAITFGDLALALGVMALCAVSELRKTRLAFLPVAALLCGLAASVLSGSRGGWIALLLVAVPLLVYRRGIGARTIVAALGLTLVLCVGAYFVPATGIAHRLAEAASDVRLYVGHGDASTSVGARLELWKASWMMFAEHPWLGVGRDGFYDALQRLAQEGKLQQSPALTYSSSHNDVLNFLATGGLLDGSFLLLMYCAPLFFFLSVLKNGDSARRAVALAGVLLVCCFIGFGLTDVMFWLMAPKTFYGTIVCALIGLCLPPRKIP